MIIVKDNFFKADLCKMVTKGTEMYRWCYNHKSDMADPTHNKFFVSYLWIPPYGDNFFHILWKLIHNEVPYVADFDCFRIIANGQVKGQNGNWHTDRGDRTVLYFPLEWAPEWGGSTFIKIEASETEIQYQRNRLLIFDSDIIHYGAGPAIHNVLRVSIAFNLRRLR
jgi:hypothetical protein